MVPVMALCFPFAVLNTEKHLNMAEKVSQKKKKQQLVLSMWTVKRRKWCCRQPTECDDHQHTPVSLVFTSDVP